MRRDILASREQLQSLNGKLSRHPFDTIYRVLEQRCGLILQSAPVDEAKWRAMWERGTWSSALLSARGAQGRIIDLLVADMIEPNQAYRSRAIEEVENLVSWTTWTDPCHVDISVDQCTAEAAVGVVIALDWLWDKIDDKTRKRWIDAIRTKAILPYIRAVKNDEWWYTCYHNWNMVINAGIGLVSLALNGSDPDAAKACKLARKGAQHFLNSMGSDGGWDEGIGYWGYAMRYLLLWAQGLKRLDGDESLYHSRGLNATGLFPIYFTPNGHSASFGEAPQEPFLGTLYLLADFHDCDQLLWWLDTYSFHRDLNVSGWSVAGLAYLFRSADKPVISVPQLEPVRKFSQIGWAAMADNWPKPLLYVSAKTGDLASNHAQHDMNAVQMQVDGEMLLIDIDPVEYRTDYYSQGRDQFYEMHARAHNTIMVSNRDHSIDARGAISAAAYGDDWRWILCDATNACGENIRFFRNIVMLCDDGDSGNLVLFVDEISDPLEETFEMFWHTFGKAVFSPGRMAGRIQGDKSGVEFAVAGTCPLDMRCILKPVNSHKNDNVIIIEGVVRERALVVSAFSTGDKCDAEIKMFDGDRLVVESSGRRVKFRRRKKSLHFIEAEKI